MKFLRPSDKTVSRSDLTVSDYVLEYGLPYFDASLNALVIGNSETALKDLKPIGLTIAVGLTTFKPNAIVKLRSGGSTSITPNGDAITIASSDTTYIAGKGLSLSGSTFNLCNATKDALGGVKLSVDGEDYDGSLITFITT